MLIALDIAKLVESVIAGIMLSTVRTVCSTIYFFLARWGVLGGMAGTS